MLHITASSLYKGSESSAANLARTNLGASTFYTSLRVTLEIFHELLQKIEPKLQTCDLYRKDTISPAERLAVTLR